MRPVSLFLCFVYALLSPGGLKDRDHVLAVPAEATDEELTDDAIESLGVNCREDHTDEVPPPTWMEQRGITRDDIVRAFACLRANLSNPEAGAC